MRKHAQATTREYRELLAKIGLTQEQFGQVFGIAERTLRRYASGEGKVSIPTTKLLRLMAAGVVTVEQVTDV